MWGRATSSWLMLFIATSPIKTIENLQYKICYVWRHWTQCLLQVRNIIEKSFCMQQIVLILAPFIACDEQVMKLR